MERNDPAVGGGLAKIVGHMVWREVRRAGRIFRIMVARAFRGPLWRGVFTPGKGSVSTAAPGGKRRGGRGVAESAADAGLAASADQAGPESARAPANAEINPTLLEKWQRRFYAKQGAREQRRQKLWREKEHEERIQPLIDPDRRPDREPPLPEQLEFEFEPASVDATLPAAAAQAPLAAEAVAGPGRHQPYQLPPLELLIQGDAVAGRDDAEIEATRKQIQDTLDSFSIDADVGDAIRGPRVTLYQVHVARGVRVNAVSAIANNLAMALSAPSLRILAPVPGEDYVGVEVPNRQSDMVRGGTFLSGEVWRASHGQLPIIMGRNIQGADVVLDLARAPHLLVAGATGSGKSVCLNSIILSLLYRFPPEELRLMLVDPKVVEMSVYRGLPHLVVPVITDVQLVVLALRWLTQEMERRYRILAKVGVRNLVAFNQRPSTAGEEVMRDDSGDPIPEKLPYIVLIIDELADIMLTCRAEVETGLARIAQMSRAVGIHAIVATQRPSVNIITGVIKANFPTRIAFQVSSQVDSRTIIDGKGAESLLGAGDMLFKPPSAARLQRLQGTMVTDAEIERVVQFCAAQGDPARDFDLLKTAAETTPTSEDDVDTDDDGFDNGNDSLLRAAMEIVIRDQKASISYVQRRLRVGYNKAATLMELMEKRGVVGPQIGVAPREILVDSMEAAVGDEDY